MEAEEILKLRKEAYNEGSTATRQSMQIEIDWRDTIISNLKEEIKNTKTTLSDCRSGIGALLTVINEMKDGHICQQPEWNDCISMAKDSYELAGKTLGEI